MRLISHSTWLGPSKATTVPRTLLCQRRPEEVGMTAGIRVATCCTAARPLERFVGTFVMADGAALDKRLLISLVADSGIPEVPPAAMSDAARPAAPSMPFNSDMSVDQLPNDAPEAAGRLFKLARAPCTLAAVLPAWLAPPPSRLESPPATSAAPPANPAATVLAPRAVVPPARLARAVSSDPAIGILARVLTTPVKGRLVNGPGSALLPGPIGKRLTSGVAGAGAAG